MHSSGEKREREKFKQGDISHLASTDARLCVRSQIYAVKKCLSLSTFPFYASKVMPHKKDNDSCDRNRMFRYNFVNANRSFVSVHLFYARNGGGNAFMRKY